MSKNVSKKLRKTFTGIRRYFVGRQRDTRYVFTALIALIVLTLSTLQALNQGLFDSIERPLFDFVNGLPTMLDSIMYGITQFGGAGSIILWVAVAWYLVSRRAAIMVALTGVFAWYAAKVMKTIIARGRPEALLENLNLFADKALGGFGFPSGHSTFVAACVTILYYQVDRKYRKYLLLTAFMVGISRMYLGAHFPLDVIGGWALGSLIGALVSLLFGTSIDKITAVQIKKALRKKGYRIRRVKFANVDARGSCPLFLETEDGTKYFAKIFGVQEHAADWLFKLYRFFKFKNLQAEEPYISSRRNIEMESFATLWAKQGGVRVPTVIDLVQVRNSWMLITEMLDMKPLADHGNLRQQSLVDAWRQVEVLHKANMAHRDLRAANLMVAKNGDVWIIDFGFAEISPRKQRQYMDVAELLMSMTLVAGVDRTVDAAMEVVDPEKLTRVLPYLQREVFSGATAKSLKSQKHLLQELKDSIHERLAIDEEIEAADIVRINFRKVLNIALIGILIYVIVPQFNLFRGVMGSLTTLNPLWLLPVIIAASLTYISSASGLVILSNVPLRLFPTIMVQLAASFVSKIVPGGLGSASLNARYLYKAGNDNTESAAILATHNVIGFVMFIVPLGLFLLIRGDSTADLISVDIRQAHLIIAGVVAFTAALVLYFNKKLRTRIIGAASQFAASIRDFASSGYEVGLTSAAALWVSLSYIACLWFCFQAFDVQLGIPAAILVFASAVIAKSVVPTPGGLGPLEIAMVSTLVSLGTEKSQALSVVVLFRLATFWLPIPFSLLAYRYVNKKKLI